MSSPVSWDVAERVGVWVSSGKLKAVSGSQLTVLDPRTKRKLDSDFARFTEQAEDLVVRATGLAPPTGPPRGHGRGPRRLGARQHQVVPATPRSPLGQARTEPDAACLVVGLRCRDGQSARVRHRLDVDSGARPVRHSLHRGLVFGYRL